MHQNFKFIIKEILELTYNIINLINYQFIIIR
jgi:hypothetical protein